MTQVQRFGSDSQAAASSFVCVCVCRFLRANLQGRRTPAWESQRMGGRMVLAGAGGILCWHSLPKSAPYSVTLGNVTSISLTSLKDNVDLKIVPCGVIGV